MSLKKLSLATPFLFLFIQISFAQVGINTTSPGAGSMLDITASDKGILIPRVNITDLTNQAPITGSITTSMLVYNSNTSTGPGYFYWDGSEWVVIGNGKFWGLNGDAGTTPGTGAGQDYVGTSDNQDFVVATNGNERFRVTNDGRILATTAGSAGTPLFGWSGDSDKGFYSSGADEFSIVTNGTQRLDIANDEIVANEPGNDVDFRVESDDQENMIFVNAAEDQVFVRNTAHHISSYIDPFNSYANSVDDGTATVGIQYAIAGWNQGTLGGGINGVIEDTGNLYAAIEGSTEAPGVAVKGLSTSNSDAIGVHGTIPTTGTWLGFGGLFQGGLAYSGGVYNVSDARVKKDIKIIDNALTRVMNIDGVSYQYDYSKYSNDARVDTKTYYGFTAQNVKTQLPHAVAEKYIPVQNTDKRSIEQKELINVVDYTAIVPVLVEAMKEQQAQIESLKNEIRALKKN